MTPQTERGATRSNQRGVGDDLGANGRCNTPNYVRGEARHCARRECVVAPGVLLTVGAVILILFVFAVVIIGMAIAARSVTKAFESHQRYNLIRHAYDKGGQPDLTAMTKAVKSLDVDLFPEQSARRHVDTRRIPPNIDGNGFPDSEDMPPALPR